MKLQPLGDRLIVEAVEEESVTKSGIVLPDQAQEKPYRGEVVAVGEDVGGPVEPGTVVIYSKYGGTEIEVDERKLIVLRLGDLLAVVKEEAS